MVKSTHNIHLAQPTILPLPQSGSLPFLLIAFKFTLFSWDYFSFVRWVHFSKRAKSVSYRNHRAFFTSYLLIAFVFWNGGSAILNNNRNINFTFDYFSTVSSQVICKTEMCSCFLFRTEHLIQAINAHARYAPTVFIACF